MKTSEEMLDDLYNRLDKYNKNKIKRHKTITTVIISCLSVCIISVASILVVSKTSEITTTNFVNETSSPAFNGKIISKDSMVYAEAMCNWNGICLPCELKDALESAFDNDVVAIEISFGYSSEAPNSIKYNGKTLSDYHEIYMNKMKTLNMSYQLLNDGDDLKLGDKLIYEGNSEGIRWAEAFYLERVNYYGDFLKKYIVNGEFLKEKLERDINEMENSQKEENDCIEAFNFVQSEIAKNIKGDLPTELILKKYIEKPDMSNSKYMLVAYFTKEHFKEFATDPENTYGYRLAYLGDGPMASDE